MKTKWKAPFITLLASALLFAVPLSASAATKSSEGATVSFGNVADGDVLPPEFRVEFVISGMGIAPAGTHIEYTGHHHLLIDVDTLPPMDQPLPATDNIVHFGKGQTETTMTLPEGSHTLQLLFADYTHTPHAPPVMSEKITITVAADAPPQKDEQKEGEG